MSKPPCVDDASWEEHLDEYQAEHPGCTREEASLAVELEALLSFWVAGCQGWLEPHEEASLTDTIIVGYLRAVGDLPFYVEAFKDRSDPWGCFLACQRLSGFEPQAFFRQVRHLTKHITLGDQ